MRSCRSSLRKISMRWLTAFTGCVVRAKVRERERLSLLERGERGTRGTVELDETPGPDRPLILCAHSVALAMSHARPEHGTDHIGGPVAVCVQQLAELQFPPATPCSALTGTRYWRPPSKPQPQRVGAVRARSNRYLSLLERQRIAMPRGQGLGVGEVVFSEVRISFAPGRQCVGVNRRT
jgi:hypothetical protein